MDCLSSVISMSPQHLHMRRTPRSAPGIHRRPRRSLLSNPSRTVSRQQFVNARCVGTEPLDQRGETVAAVAVTHPAVEDDPFGAADQIAEGD